ARVQAFAHHLRPGNPYVGVVHRIDRGTSGTLVFALTPPARDALRALFRDHRMERRYTALVLGTPSGDVGLVDRPIHDSYQGGRRRIARAGEPSHPALTRYRVLERLPHAAFLEVELETGRQHQIRLHLASIGLPIVGDLVYGGGPGPGRPMLHARTLRFVHPITGHTVTAESPLPADFSATLLSLRRGQTVAGTSSRGPRRPRAARVEEPRRGPRPGRKAPRGGTR
ncbi:MAG TPA: RluA family pseudouridine synthase, partial [Vicinamibacteria bacterium]|nr:RluA family pseudouridine synthase [Vicinamibacteria bacterium]